MLIVLPVSIATSLAVVLIHLGVLQTLSSFLDRFDKRPRMAIALSIVGAILGHVVEIGLFAVAFAMLLSNDHFGSIEGQTAVRFADLYYFSAVTYTSLGYGDLHPVGQVRTLALVEAITGIIMIAWTGSFAFIQMQRNWKFIHRSNTK